MSHFWKERTAEIFQLYNHEQQQLQNEERRQRLAKKLEAMGEPAMRCQHIQEKENYRDELELRLNDLNERFNTLSHRLDREMQSIGEQVLPPLIQTTAIEQSLEKSRLLGPKEHLTGKPSELQQCQQKYTLLVEKEMDNRRSFETELANVLDNSTSDLTVAVLKENEKCMDSLELHKSRTSRQLVEIRALIEQLTRRRSEDQEQLITELSQSCRDAEDSLAEFELEQSATEQEQMDMLREVAVKVAQELQLQALDRKRTEQQILMLIEAMCDRIRPCG